MASLSLQSDSRNVQDVTRSSAGVWIGILATTIFVSAFLLFQVQPLISKLILPWFGGSPTVWTTAMLFFQCVLFAGYAYAHLVTRYVSLRIHLLLHLVLLSLSAVMSLLITPGEYLKPNGDENPAIQILLLLVICVGLPYFTLASTGPLVQAWFSKIYPGQSPYRLYALSNAGSFFALLSFPYLFEPYFHLPQLGLAWTGLFWIFAILCSITVAWLLPNAEKLDSKRQSTESSPGAARSYPTAMQRVAWIGLPALASLTMIATTDHVSHNVAPEPRLWITTLGLYLLTFIITFDHERWYRRGSVAAACLLSILFLTSRSGLVDLLGIEWDFGVTETRWSHFVVMFLICFLCHGELVKLRPEATAYLTEFYLCISAGGACGGLFASLIAVNFFTDYYEWPLCLVIAATLSLWILNSTWLLRSKRPAATAGVKWAIFSVSLLVSTLWIGFWMDPFEWQPSSSAEYTTKPVFAGRNFYGTIAVDDRIHKTNPSESYRVFYSGSVLHGIQLSDPSKYLRPVSYYAADSGAGETLEYLKARQKSLRIAVVGLGTGSLAAYGREDDQIDFYEINPEVIRIAKEHFSFIRECKSKANLVLGDGRLKMDESIDAIYDAILLDAFSGGSVPVHLLTREAFAMYQRHLAPKGCIVIHITNSHLNLYPIVKLQAESLGIGYQSKFVLGDSDNFTRRNQYFTMTDDQEFLANFPSQYPPTLDENDQVIDRQEPKLGGATLWTDHFSSINAIELDE